MAGNVVVKAHHAQRRHWLAATLSALFARLAMLVAVERNARPSPRAEGGRGGWRDSQGTRAGVVSNAAFVSRALR
jgi:hypothetical protein